jgi:hypothetical protein
LAQKPQWKSRDFASPFKTPEGWRSPGRFAYFKHHRAARSVLEYGGPSPLFPEAYQTAHGWNDEPAIDLP